MLERDIDVLLPGTFALCAWPWRAHDTLAYLQRLPAAMHTMIAIFFPRHQQHCIAGQHALSWQHAYGHNADFFGLLTVQEQINSSDHALYPQICCQQAIQAILPFIRQLKGAQAWGVWQSIGL